MTTRGDIQDRLIALAHVSAAFDAWRMAAAEGRETVAGAHAVQVQVWVAAGAPPEWTAAERAAFEGWCRQHGREA